MNLLHPFAALAAFLVGMASGIAFAHTGPDVGVYNVGPSQFAFPPITFAQHDAVFDSQGNPVNLADTGTIEAQKEEAQTESTFLKVLGALLTALIPVIGVLAKAWRDKLLAEKDQTKFSTGMGIALNLFDAFLTEASRELLPKLREALADGILTEAERADLRKAVLGLVTSKLPGEVFGTLTKAFGPGLQSWLDHQADVAIDRAAKDTVVPK